MIKLKFHGLGGQGVVTAAKIFAAAVSLYEGKYANTVPAYGHERRGAPVETSIIIDEKEVLVNSFVYDPDILLIMDHKVIDKNEELEEEIDEETVLILNTDNEKILAKYKKFNFKELYFVNGTKVALETIGREIPNTSMLGALAKTGNVSINSIKKAIKDSFKGKEGEINARAAEKAYENCKKA